MIRASRLSLSCALGVVLGLLVPSVSYADLESLVSEYTRAKSQLRGDQEKRDKFIKEHLEPKLVAIGELNDAPSLSFLKKEYRVAKGVLAVACVRAALKNSSPNAVAVVLGGFKGKSPDTTADILKDLARAERDFAPNEKLVLKLLSKKHPRVREKVPAVVIRLGSLKSAEVLFATVKAKSPSAYSSAVAEALADDPSEDLKKWFVSGAWDRASTAQTLLLLKLVRVLKLEEARPHVVDHIDHSDSRVALEAFAAVEVLGIDAKFADKVGKMVEKGVRSRALKIRMLDSLVLSGEDKAIEAVVQLANEGGKETRIIAMGSLGLTGSDRRALETLVVGLRDKVFEVRNIAVRSLSRFRSKAMVAPLIEFLATEKNHKLRVESLRVLVKLTGKNMGLETEDWQNWWEASHSGFELPKEGEDEFTKVKAYDLAYFGLDVGASKRMAFLCDFSGSMTEKVTVKKADGSSGSERKIDVLKKELVRVIEKLPKDAAINIIYFDASYKPWKKKLYPLKGKGRAQAVNWVQSRKNGSGTNVFDTLEFSLHDKQVDTIFLLTDGNPSRGKYLDPEVIATEVGILNRLRGVTINCIAFGEKSPLLERLAAENGGEYRFVDSY